MERSEWLESLTSNKQTLGPQGLKRCLGRGGHRNRPLVIQSSLSNLTRSGSVPVLLLTPRQRSSVLVLVMLFCFGSFFFLYHV